MRTTASIQGAGWAHVVLAPGSKEDVLAQRGGAPVRSAEVPLSLGACAAVATELR